VGDPEPSNPPSRRDLPSLLAEVRRTRAEHQQTQRLAVANPLGLIPTRRASLRALEAYARAVDLQGWPLPTKMQLEIQLLRSLCGRDGFRR
jgi:hypothetical protein